LAAAKPIEPTTNSAAAAAHSPRPTNHSSPVPTIPIRLQAIRKRLRRPQRSAIAPSAGASTATTKPATPLAKPSREVLTVGSTPRLQ